MVFKKKALKISIAHNEANSLHCKVSHVHSGDSWFILNVYAPNSKRERRVFWMDILDVICNNNINKCVIMGDFNSLLTDEEKSRGLALDQ